jgi:hypothetical protein
MRRFTFFLFAAAILIFAGICSAQDTNSSQDSSYGPHFQHPLETPSLDLSAPKSQSPNAPATEHTGVPDSPAFGGLENQSQVDEVYYGSQSSGTPLPPTVAEFVPVEPAAPPASGSFNVGVSAIANPSGLRDQGYGVSLAQAAAYWRLHKTQVVRTYTNADTARLPGG